MFSHRLRNNYYTLLGNGREVALWSLEGAWLLGENSIPHYKALGWTMFLFLRWRIFCVPVEAKDWHRVSSSITLHVIVWDRTSLWTCSSSIRLHKGATGIHLSAFPGTESTGVHPHPGNLTVGLNHLKFQDRTFFSVFFFTFLASLLSSI